MLAKCWDCLFTRSIHCTVVWYVCFQESYKLQCNLCQTVFGPEQIYVHMSQHSGGEFNIEQYDRYISNIVVIMDARQVLGLFIRKIYQLYSRLVRLLRLEGVSSMMLPLAENEVANLDAILRLGYGTRKCNH